jgi:hypothetical protein
MTPAFYLAGLFLIAVLFSVYTEYSTNRRHKYRLKKREEFATDFHAWLQHKLVDPRTNDVLDKKNDFVVDKKIDQSIDDIAIAHGYLKPEASIMKHQYSANKLFEELRNHWLTQEEELLVFLAELEKSTVVFFINIIHTKNLVSINHFSVMKWPETLAICRI